MVRPIKLLQVTANLVRQLVETTGNRIAIHKHFLYVRLHDFSVTTPRRPRSFYDTGMANVALPLMMIATLLGQTPPADQPDAPAQAVAPTPTGNAIPPLTDAQKMQLDSTGDNDGVIDAAGLYALLANVANWPNLSERVGPIGGAVIPDYQQMLEEPGNWRGQLMWIGGQFGGQQRDIPLARPGPWGEAVKEWGILIERAGQQGDDDLVVVVLLVDPHGVLRKPPPARRVAVACRFYKVWATVDLRGEPVRFLTFVGRYPQVGNPGGDEPGRLLPSVTPGSVILLVVIAAGIGFWWVRRMRSGTMPPQRMVLERRRQRRAARRDPQDGHDQSDAADQPPLPTDPADALSALATEHDESQTSIAELEYSDTDAPGPGTPATEPPGAIDQHNDADEHNDAEPKPRQ